MKYHPNEFSLKHDAHQSNEQSSWKSRAAPTSDIRNHPGKEVIMQCLISKAYMALKGMGKNEFIAE